MTGRLSIALISLAWGAAAAAETAYVTDILQLGLHRASDTSDRPFENLPSGTRLEILERTTHYARVRTDDGDEGWVKAAYIVSETPARFRVAELEAKLDALAAELADAHETERRATAEAERLRNRETEHMASMHALKETVARLEAENAEYLGRVERYRVSLPLSWVLAAIALTFVGGAAAGWWALDAFIRRRYAGYRLY